MAAVTLSTQGFFVNGTVGTVFGDHLIVTPTSVDTYTLPSNAPVGYRFTILNTTALALTVAAPAGQTIVGTVATTTANTRVHCVKTGATTWVGYTS